MVNDLELLKYRCDGMLGDDANIIEKLYNHILDNPIKLLNYGSCVGFAFRKIARGPVTMSVLVGTVAGAGMTYYIKKKNEAN